VSSGNVVGTWPEVQALVDGVQGAARVWVDTSLAAAVIPAGTWNGYGSAEINSSSEETFLVTIADGGTLKNWARITRIILACTCTTTAALSFPNTGTTFVLDDFGGIALLAGATVPAIQLSVAGFSFAMISRMGVLDNSLAPTVPVINVAAGTTATFYEQCAAFNFSALVTGNEIGGGAGATVDWNNDDTVPPLTSALFTGTLSATPSSDAGNIQYTAANVGNWSGTNPSSVANALDRIAAKIGPIP
jgi:hypothetical protein